MTLKDLNRIFHRIMVGEGIIKQIIPDLLCLTDLVRI
jgi:hypothetical protein